MAVEYKAIEIKKEVGDNIIEARVTGKLTADDYENFVPAVECAIKEHGKVRILLELIDFHGWNAGALWEDIKFDVKHFNDIDRLAIVGDKKWEKGMAVFCKPFTTAEVRYFDVTDLDKAHDWIRE